MTVLVTGGAGYIGAHVVRLLLEQGEGVVVVDNVSTGEPGRIGGGALVELNLSVDSSQDDLARVMQQDDVTSVIHIAGKKQVGESVDCPTWYYRQNVHSMSNLLQAMETSGVDRLVFSSSAAAYGTPDQQIVDENTPCSPINPYGQTKLVGEWMTRNAANAWGLRVANLRYFNVAGTGWPDLKDPSALNLIPIVLGRLQRGEAPIVFGDTYGTPDGTCIRDYVHVLDLASAHISALRYLDDSVRPHDVFNVGTGRGASVLDVLKTIAEVTGIDTTPIVQEPRVGDPAKLVADVSRIADSFGWSATHDLVDIITSAAS